VAARGAAAGPGQALGLPGSARGRGRAACQPAAPLAVHLCCKPDEGAVARPCGTCPSARPGLPAAVASFCACWQAAWEPRDATQPMFSQGVRGPFKRPAVRVSMCVGSLRQCMALPCCRSAPGSTACCGAAPGVLEGIWAHCLVVLALRVQVRCCGVAWAPCRGRLPERQWPAGEAARVKKQMRQCMHGAVCSLVTSLVVASSGTVSSFCTDHGSSTM